MLVDLSDAWCRQLKMVPVQVINIIALVVLLMALAEPVWGLSGPATPNGFSSKPGLVDEKNAFNCGRDRMAARPGNEIWVGDPNYGSTLQDAIKTLGDAVAKLRIPVGVHHIGADLTIPATLALKLEPGAVLTRNGRLGFCIQW